MSKGEMTVLTAAVAESFALRISQNVTKAYAVHGIKMKKTEILYAVTNDRIGMIM